MGDALCVLFFGCTGVSFMRGCSNLGGCSRLKPLLRGIAIGEAYSHRNASCRSGFSREQRLVLATYPALFYITAFTTRRWDARLCCIYSVFVALVIKPSGWCKRRWMPACAGMTQCCVTRFELTSLQRRLVQRLRLSNQLFSSRLRRQASSVFVHGVVDALRGFRFGNTGPRAIPTWKVVRG